MTFAMPPEWAPQDWLWIGFPHDAEEWPGYLARAQEQIAAFANAVAESGQEVRLLVRDVANQGRAAELVSSAVTLEQRVYGDIWLRDTGPLVLSDGSSRKAAQFGFNGWGGKYEMPGDTAIGAEIADDAGLAIDQHDWVLEGGAIDGDGAGLVVTTQQCLLNPNRNPALDREQIEQRLLDDLGFEHILWLGDGLINDHTDGHVDNLARFVAPRTLAVAVPEGADDPNIAIYDDVRRRAHAAGISVCDIPSPGRVIRDGVIEPASYANFAITSHLVVVPTFGCANDAAAVSAISALFPDRETVGLPADAVLAGGGGFHCASQQMPSLHSPK
ncbi:agmatine deiminase family protein [Altererythrobacter sp. RZ02]|uniref:Agmatine deiminase family protein n=1 Tax=Pontixanthobacter rizhaonensis TaxID=2730337 RepID=A0A848QQV5_9SPHN|nr:agmatine deiminase family protein [Pontixanthobacter rizhaonensis]NMW32495.1 agmatine deiminase family protein [Pontixanthobacter rizhaonensis]